MHLKKRNCLAGLLTTLVLFGCKNVIREQIIKKAIEESSSFEEVDERDSQTTVL